MCLASTPLERPTPKYPDYPTNVKAKIAEKRRLRIWWQYSQNPQDNHNFNVTARNLKEMTMDFKNQSFHPSLQNLKSL